jgi:hypothetical protein
VVVRLTSPPPHPPNFGGASVGGDGARDIDKGNDEGADVGGASAAPMKMLVQEAPTKEGPAQEALVHEETRAILIHDMPTRVETIAGCQHRPEDVTEPQLGDAAGGGGCLAWPWL